MSYDFSDAPKPECLVKASSFGAATATVYLTLWMSRDPKDNSIDASFASEKLELVFEGQETWFARALINLVSAGLIEPLERQNEYQITEHVPVFGGQ